MEQIGLGTVMSSFDKNTLMLYHFAETASGVSSLTGIPLQASIAGVLVDLYFSARKHESETFSKRHLHVKLEKISYGNSIVHVTNEDFKSPADLNKADA